RYGSISLGATAIAVSLAMRLNSLAPWVLWEVSAITEHVGTVLDGARTLTHPLEIEDAEEATELVVREGRIDFHAVTFAYDQHHSVFENLNLSIRGGEKVGIVGRSGAGKSTLVSILLRFYDVQSGSITIDGMNISRVRQESLRRHLGVVTQDNALLHRSIKENIRYGCPSATDTAVMEAAKGAQAHEFIMGLSDAQGRCGYDVQVGERGVKLSGGQRQRIAIARVLLKNAPILILDEATSALDSEVELAIQSNLNTLMQGKTVIAIAHRLSTIAALDRLIVLDEGRIVESGTHEDLLVARGLYAKLWQHQSGGFIGVE
ncbi:MAG: ATP-binding cassette domain-containing protein, partial [Gammaproteobacteria bacterium]